MKWSWRIGEFLGIRVYVHATFLLLIGWIILSHILQRQTMQSAVAGVLFTIAIFVSVLLHEYGHALAARRFGIGTRDITLLPIGGVARLERMPEEPKRELWVALAGPVANLAISAALFVILFVMGALKPLAELSVTGGPFLEQLMIANIFLALFNLLPAFPMDGGRVLRALLATRLPYVRATKIAGYLALGIASLTMSSPVVYGDNTTKAGFEIEAGPVWQSRNDVRIPNDTGTEFSLRDIQGSGPFAAARVYFDYAFLPKHELRFMAAPLTLKGSGQLEEPIFFANATFSPGQPVEGIYQFNSYRFTYRYRIYDGDRWTWKLGVTGKIRDAKIELRQGGLSAADENVGFVPLVHLDGEYRWNEKWRLNMNMDGFAVSQGRAFDVALKLKYDFSRNWTLGFGYRMLEGGADVKDVYTFGWLHYAAASIGYRF